MAMMSKNNYKKIEKEDKEELIHRRAQFLIQKVLEKVDHEMEKTQRKRSSGPLILIRVVGIKMKIGKKLRRLRKTNHNTYVKCNNFISRFLKSFRRLLSSSSSSRTISDLPPLFSIQV